MPPGWPFELDFLYFISGFIFIFSAMESLILSRLDAKRCVWEWLALFFLLQGVQLLWGADAFIFGAANPVHLVRSMMESLSLCSLFSFGLLFLIPIHARRNRLILLGSVSAASIILTLVVGVNDILSLCNYALGICGALIAMIKLPRSPGLDARHSRWLRMVGVALASFCVLGFLDLLYRHSRLFDVRQIMQVGISCISVALGAGILAHQAFIFRQARRGAYGLPARIMESASNIIIPLIIAGGWILTSGIAKNAEEQERANALLQIRSVSSVIESQTAPLNSVSTILSRLTAVRHRLTTDDPRYGVTVHEILDGMVSLDIPYVIFITDTGGTIIDSSFSGSSAISAGKNISRQALFMETAQRGSARIYTQDPNGTGAVYYSATAVTAPDGRFLGVVAAGVEMTSMSSAFAAVRNCFLVDETGTIFLGQDMNLRGRRLWDTGEKPAGSLPQSLDSSTPPDNGVGPLTMEEPSYGQTMGFFNGPAFVTRLSMAPSGWSLVLYRPVEFVLRERLVGIAATLLAVLIVSGMTVIVKIWLVSTAQVARSESLYRTLIQSSPNWVSIVSPQGIMQFTDDMGPRILGMNASEILGSKLVAVFGEEQGYRVGAAISAAYDGSEPETEISLTARDGAVSVWHLRAVPLNLGEEARPATMLIGTDITASKEAERRILRAERMAAVGTFAAGVAHQFNNINTAVLGNLELLGAEERIPADLRAYVDAARFALDRSIEITSRLLILTEAYSGTVIVAPLGAMVDEILARARPPLERDGVRVTQDTSGSLPVRVSTRHVDFILSALLSNAAHAVSGRTERVIDVRTGDEGGRTFLRVCDTGIGIAPDRLDKIFTPFFTEKGEFAPAGSVQRSVRGVGLSLAVCFSLVSGHGGSIEVESTPGAGSRFTVWLPAASPPRRDASSGDASSA